MQDKLLREISYCELCGRSTTSPIGSSLGKICGACHRIVEGIAICPECGKLVNKYNSVDVEDGMRTIYYHHECFKI